MKKPKLGRAIDKTYTKAQACELQSALGALLKAIDDEPERFAGYYRRARAERPKVPMTLTEFLRFGRDLFEASKAIEPAAYRDDKFEPELCHHCGVEYRGPALYCSLTCAIADA
jgi:hypothetical protein